MCYEAIRFLVEGAAREMFDETKDSDYDETAAAEDRYVATVVGHLRRGADPDAAANDALSEMVAGEIREVSSKASVQAVLRAAEVLVADIQTQGHAVPALEELVRSAIHKRYWELIDERLHASL